MANETNLIHDFFKLMVSVPRWLLREIIRSNYEHF